MPPVLARRVLLVQQERMERPVRRGPLGLWGPPVPVQLGPPALRGLLVLAQLGRRVQPGPLGPLGRLVPLALRVLAERSR